MALIFMNIFRYLDSLNDSNEIQKSLDWIALGIFFNILMTKGLRASRLPKHQRKFIQDVRDSLQQNFGGGSKAESKLIRFSQIKQLASNFGLNATEQQRIERAKIIDDVKRFRESEFSKDDDWSISSAQKNRTMRSNIEAALMVAEAFGSNRKEYFRTQKNKAKLEEEARQFWGAEVPILNAVFDMLCGVFQFTPEESKLVTVFILNEVLMKRGRKNPSFATGQAREVILAGYLRSISDASEIQIQEELASKFPSPDNTSEP